MKGIVFTGDRKVELRDFPDPTPGPRDVVVEIRASGMCGSDLHVYRSRRPSEPLMIAGHEPCGVVAAVGSAVTETAVGDRVMVHHYYGCEVCRHCRSGWSQLCLRGATFMGSGGGHGGHAPYLLAPAHTLVALPDELSFAAGAAVACGTGTAYGALDRVGLRGDQTVIVFGQGPVGLSATMLAQAMGARVVAVDPSADRRRQAEARGAHLVLDPTVDDVPAAVRELTEGEGAHVAVETSGATAGRTDAVRSVRTWGSVALVGLGGELQVSDVWTDLIARQVNLVGHVTFSKNGLADCARFVVERELDVDGLFTDRWTLDQAAEAYRHFDGQTTGKGWFDPTATATA